MRVKVPFPIWKRRGWRRSSVLPGEAVTPLGAAYQRDPEEARRMLLDALECSGGKIVSAANQLGSCRRGLVNYVGKLGLWPEVDRIRMENGVTKWLPKEKREALKAQSTRVDSEKVA